MLSCEFLSKTTEVCSQGNIWQQSIDLDDSLSPPVQCQAFTWTNDDAMPQGHNE